MNSPMRFLAYSAWFMLVIAGCATGTTTAISEHLETKEGEVKPLELPEVQKFKLSNGMTVLIVENHQVPYAAFRMVFKAGALQDPVGKEGLAKMTTALMTYGTSTKTEEEISQKVDSLGASLGAFTGGTDMQVYGDITTVNPTNLNDFFSLFAEVVVDPVFPETSLDKMRTRMIGGLASTKEDNSSLAERAFGMTLFDGHPYGRPAGGHPRTLRTLERSDLVDFHQRYFVPEHAVLGVSGDVDPEEVIALAETLFPASWGESDGKRICEPMMEMEATCAAFTVNGTTTRNEKLHIPREANPLPEGLRILVVDRQDPGLNQVQWRMGHQGTFTFDSPEWFDFRLGTQLVGGDFTARLNQTLRVKEGLTYGARLVVRHGKNVPGKVAVSTYVKPKDLRRAIELTLGELEGAMNTPLPDAEVAGFQSKIIEGLPFRFETASDTLAEYMSLIAGDRDVAFLRGYPQGIAEVTPESAQTALRKGLQTQSLLLVVVANADIVEELQPLVDARGGSIDVIPVENLFLE